jgi:hypothetical protein
LRQQDRDSRTAGTRPAFRDQPAELLLRPRQVPAPRELSRNLEADVVAGRGVVLAGIAKADDEDAVPLLLALAAIGSAAKEGQGLLPAGVA